MHEDVVRLRGILQSPVAATALMAARQVFLLLGQGISYLGTALGSAVTSKTDIPDHSNAVVVDVSFRHDNIIRSSTQGARPLTPSTRTSCPKCATSHNDSVQQHVCNGSPHEIFKTV